MPTLEEFAAHLDMTVQNLRKVLKRMGVDHRTASIDQVRVAYIRHMRAIAAGRGGDDQYNLTKAKARESQISGDLKSVDLAERLGELVPAEEVADAIEDAFSAVRSELLALPERIAALLENETGAHVKPELLHDLIAAALGNLAAREGDPTRDDPPKLAELPAAH